MKASFNNNLEPLDAYISKQKDKKNSKREKQQRKSEVKDKRQIIKLSTILQNGDFSHKFPKIKNTIKDKEKNPKRRYQKAYKKSRVLTIDTRLSTDEQSSILSSDFKLDIKQLNKPENQEYYLLDELSEFQFGNQPSLRFLSRQNTGTIDRESFDYLRQQKSEKPILKSVVIQNQIKEEQTTSSDQQYIKDANPGPGSYSIQNYSDLVKRTMNRSQRLSFCSKASRFTQKKYIEQDSQLAKKILQEEQARQKKIKVLNKKQKKYIPFNSQSPKRFVFQKNENFPSPLYYNPRFGIEEDLIKKIQRNFKGKFGVDQKRFVSQGKNKQHLGPGTYTIQPSSGYQTMPSPSHYFKSKINRFQN